MEPSRKSLDYSVNGQRRLWDPSLSLSDTCIVIYHPHQKSKVNESIESWTATTWAIKQNFSLYNYLWHFITINKPDQSTVISHSPPPPAEDPIWNTLSSLFRPSCPALLTVPATLRIQLMSTTACKSPQMLPFLSSQEALFCSSPVTWVRRTIQIYPAFPGKISKLYTSVSLSGFPIALWNLKESAAVQCLQHC